MTKEQVSDLKSAIENQIRAKDVLIRAEIVYQNAENRVERLIYEISNPVKCKDGQA